MIYGWRQPGSKNDSQAPCVRSAYCFRSTFSAEAEIVRPGNQPYSFTLCRSAIKRNRPRRNCIPDTRSTWHACSSVKIGLGFKKAREFHKKSTYFRKNGKRQSTTAWKTVKTGIKAQPEIEKDPPSLWQARSENMGETKKCSDVWIHQSNLSPYYQLFNT